MKRHSARIPGKNFKIFAGKPLFAWILETLLSSKSISQVVINTDAADQLHQLGWPRDRVIVRERAPEICGDDVSMNRVIEDDLRHIQADRYLMTHTTNPLISRNTLEDALGRFQQGLQSGICDSLFSVNRLQTRLYQADGSPINHDPANLIPTQELEPWFEENSNLYLFTQSSFRSTGARIGKRPLLYETPKWESTDIDTPSDWQLAEFIMGQRLLSAGHDQCHNQNV